MIPLKTIIVDDEPDSIELLKIELAHIARRLK